MPSTAKREQGQACNVAHEKSHLQSSKLCKDVVNTLKTHACACILHTGQTIASTASGGEGEGDSALESRDRAGLELKFFDTPQTSKAAAASKGSGRGRAPPTN